MSKKHKITPGDGRPLRPFRWWELIARSLFYTRLRTNDDVEQLYAVEVKYFEWEDFAELYLNGKHHARAKLPAAFPVEGGHIEVAATTYGLKRMHYVSDDGGVAVLKPEPASAEGLRARFAARAPFASKLLSLGAILILLFFLPFGLMTLAEIVTQTELAQQYVGQFVAPISLPSWAEGPAFVLSILAVTERALTLRNNWLIDMETGWFE